LALLFGQSFHPGDGGVRDGEYRPLVSGKAGTRGKGKEIIVTVGVAGRGQGNGTKGTSLGGVGRGVGLEELDIGAKFETELVEINGGTAGDNGGGTHGMGDTVGPRELVEAAKHMCDHVVDHNFGEALIREAVGASAEAFFDGPDGPFDFADVAVGGDDVGGNREK